MGVVRDDPSLQPVSPPTAKLGERTLITIVPLSRYRAYLGIMEKKIETTILGLPGPQK